MEETERVRPRVNDVEVGYEALPECCANTIRTHATHNPMMVCQDCKQLIKCFRDKIAFQDYIVFCRSRGRKVLIARHDPFDVVIFNAYEPYR